MRSVAGSASPGTVRSPTITSPILRVLAVAGLLLVGVTLLVLGSVTLFDNSAPGASTVAKQSTTEVTAPAKDQAGTTTTAVSSRDVATPGEPSFRSESLAATLFALGAIVFLIGIFFGRIQEITLPGGGGFKLSPETTEAVKEKVAKKLKQDPTLTEDPQTAIALYESAISELPVLQTSPGDDVLDRAIDRAAQNLQ